MPYNVFISWSKERSRKVATELYRFIPDVIQQATPWFSAEDIETGSRWEPAIATALQDLKIGIICLTPENLESTWLHFEAGALSKSLSEARVCPYLLDCGVADVRPPLAAFQSRKADKPGTLRLIEDLNVALGNPVEIERLRRTFELFWSGLDAKLKQIAEEKPTAKKAVPPRPAEDMFAEIIARLRDIDRPYIEIGASGESSVPPPLPERTRRQSSLTRKVFTLAREGKAVDEISRALRIPVASVLRRLNNAEAWIESPGDVGSANGVEPGTE